MKILIIVIFTVLAVLAINCANASGQTSTAYGGLVGYRTADFKTPDSTFQIWYKITNGTVVSTPLDLSAKSLIFFIDASNNGQLVVDLPRSIIDSRNENSDKPFFVTVHKASPDVSNAIFSETNDTYVRTLKINFTRDTSEIEIYGNLLAPKYPLSKTPSVASPLWQIKHGVKPDDIQCNFNFTLVFKSKDNLPACVKHDAIIPLTLRGWTNGSTNHEMVYFMKSNATAQIFVKFSSNRFDGPGPAQPITLNPRFYSSGTNSGYPTDRINATTVPDSVQLGSTTLVTYTITTHDTPSGVYWLSIDGPCDSIPVVVNIGLSQITKSDLQSPTASWKCPGPLMQHNIVGVNDMTIGLVSNELL
jgi:hypothetical protein